MIQCFVSKALGDGFYAMMGTYFADLEIAQELEKQVYNKPFTDWYVSVDNSIRRASMSERVQGFASVHFKRNHLFIDNLYVRPKCRNKGIATEIISNIVSKYSGSCRPLRCIAVNPYAMAIFKKFGFEEVGTVGKYTKLEKH